MIGNRILMFLCVALLFCLWNCSEPKTTGNSTQTENAVSLRLLSADGKPAPGVAYSVLPMWYVADSSGQSTAGIYLFQGVSDVNGWIRLENHPAGNFQILINDLLYGVVSQYSLSAENPQVISEEIIMKKKGAVSGKVNLPAGAKYAWIYILGLDRMTRTDSVGKFTIPELPVGTLRLLAVSATDTRLIGEAVVQIPEGDTTAILSFESPDSDNPYIAAWRYSQKLDSRTLVSEWMRPLPSRTVLTLRLDSTNFDFSQAQNDGSDLRILDASDQPLAMQIDWWDTTSRKAIINVYINTGSDTVGDWTLMWGNPFAPGISTNVWKGLPDSLVLAIHSVLLADFENGTSDNALLPPATTFHWYSATGDSNATVIPAKNEPFYNALMPADYGRTGIAAAISYSAISPKYAMIGTRMVSTPHGFAHLDSLELWARGDGQFTIILESLDLENNVKAVYKGSNQEQWTRIVIRPADFSPADSIGGNYGWEAVKNVITTFTVFLNDGSTFWIDDIRFYGINRDDLL